MSKKVSICIPVYKQKEYLKKCLESVLIQDFIDYEIIISDDTPDDSLEVFIKSILGDRAYIYSRNKPALGTPQNWNSAIEKATGQYIKVLHHDDFFTQTNSLKLMVEEIDFAQADFLFCQTDVWYPVKDYHRIHSISNKQFEIIKTKPEFLFFKNVIGAPSATLYKNKSLIKYDIDYKWLVDVDFYIQQFLAKKKIVFLAKPLICTSHAIESQVTTNVEKDKLVQIKEHVLLFNKIKKHVKNYHAFNEFFDYLFFDFAVKNFKELIEIVPQAEVNKEFYEGVLTSVPKNRKFKKFKKRFYGSRYNNYFFKLEQFI